MVCQQAQNGGTEGRHSPTESRGHSVSAGTKWRDRGQALTNWRAEDTVCQQVQNRGTEGRHSPTEEWGMCSVNRQEIQLILHQHSPRYTGMDEDLSSLYPPYLLH
jgi:hypothetical protein